VHTLKDQSRRVIPYGAAASLAIGLLLGVQLLSPLAVAQSSFVFSAGGDIGANPRANASLRAIVPQGSTFFWALGDLSYDQRTPETSWCTYVTTRVGATFPFQLIAGNHEDDARRDGHISEFAKCLPDRMNSQGFYGIQYYFDYENVRFIAISPALPLNGVTYDYNTIGGEHYNWLAQTIDDARSTGKDWVVVAMHKVCITSGAFKCAIGVNLMNLLLEKKVDLILQAHEHNYQRSKQLALSPACPTLVVNGYDADCVVDNGADNQYGKGLGSVLLIIGTCGQPFHAFTTGDPERPYFARRQATTNGIVKFTVSSTRIDVSFVSTYGPAFADTFFIG
jgi:hypothetical protein